MNYGSICSGVEAATLAWEPLGWKAVFFSEVEPFPAAVLQQRFGATRPKRLLPPAEAETEVRGLAAVHNLFLTRVTRVYSKETKPARRVLMAFEISKHRNIEISTDSLTLEDEKGGRSAAYSKLCEEFYL